MEGKEHDGNVHLQKGRKSMINLGGFLTKEHSSKNKSRLSMLQYSKGKMALQNPLYSWDFISASILAECDKCLTTYSGRWHDDRGRIICHACFVDMHREACPLCGQTNAIRDAGAMTMCVSCNRSTHLACEVATRSQPHPESLCISCEMKLLLIEDNKGRKPLDIALKALPTMMNNHIFKYQAFFGHRSAALAQDDRSHTTDNPSQTIVSKSAQVTRNFRETLGLPPLLNSPASELSRENTYLAPGSARTVNACSTAHSVEFWGEQDLRLSSSMRSKAGFAGDVADTKWNVREESPGLRADTEALTLDSAGTIIANTGDFEPLPSPSALSERHIHFDQEFGKEFSSGPRPATTTDVLRPYQQRLEDKAESLPKRSRTGQARNLMTSAASAGNQMQDRLHSTKSGAYPSSDRGHGTQARMFSWDRRALTASDKLKKELLDPPPHGIAHPVRKFLAPRANEGYVPQSPRLRTHFSGISPRRNDSAFKVDCWRECDRRRLDTARSLLRSPPTRLEHRYASTLRQITAFDNGLNPTPMPQLNLSWINARKDEGRRPYTDRPSEQRKLDKTEMSAALDVALDSPVARAKPQVQKVLASIPAGHAGSKSTGFISARNRRYDTLINFIQNDMDSFGAGIVDLCRPEYTPQQFFEAVYNQQYQPKTDGEPVACCSPSPQSSINSVVSIFQQHTQVLHDIGESLANKIYLVNENHGIKLTLTQAILITMRDFGIYPTLLGTRRITAIVLQCMTDCIHGFPESEARRTQNVLEAVLLDVAITVFREDPENLGIHRVVDQGADDSHVLQVLLAYMKLDDRRYVASFLAKFLSPQEAENKVEAEKQRTANRFRMRENFAGTSDPIKQTIVRWQRALQDMFHFFASPVPIDTVPKPPSSSHRVVPEVHESYGDAAAEVQVFYRVEPVAHEPRTSLLRNSQRRLLEVQNETKVRKLKKEREELLQKLNIRGEDDSEDLRGAVKRVGPTAVLMQSGKIDRAEATLLAACLAQPDALQEQTKRPAAAKYQQSHEDLAREKQIKSDKLTVFERVVATSFEDRTYMILDDLVALYGGESAPAKCLWESIPKSNPQLIDRSEFVDSIWTDSLCATLLPEIRLEQSNATEEEPGKLRPLALRVPAAKLALLRNDLMRTREADAGVDLDDRVGEVRQEKMHVNRKITELLSRLWDQVAEITEAAGPRIKSEERSPEEMASSFEKRLAYQTHPFEDVYSSEPRRDARHQGHERDARHQGQDSLLDPIVQRRLGHGLGNPVPADKAPDLREESHLGLKWREAPERPETGQEIRNSALAKALQQKLELTHAQLDAMNLSGQLSSESFIQVGEKYMIPDQRKKGMVRTLTHVKLVKRRLQKLARSESSDVLRDDSMPERRISPGFAISTGSLFKLADMFCWIGTQEQVLQGVALMQDFELARICHSFALSKSAKEFCLNWNDFLDFLIEVARTCVKKIHVQDNLQLDESTSSMVEGLIWFMSLPHDTIARRNWLVERAADVLRFKLYERVGNEAPSTLWLLPPANLPWRNGLHLRNDIRDVEGADVYKRLLDGNRSKPAPDNSWSSRAIQNKPFGRVPSMLSSPLLRVPSNSNRTSSSGSPPRHIMHAEADPTVALSRLSSAAKIFSRAGSVASVASAAETQSWFCIMFCDSRKDVTLRDTEIFQAVAWRHELRFFRCDLAENASSEEFAHDNNVTNLPCLRLYCVNGLYREFTGHWDVGSMDWWLDEQQLPENSKDNEHFLHCVYDDVIEYFELDDGVGSYLDAYLSLTNSSSQSSTRVPDPIRSFASLFAGQVLDLRNIDLSGPEMLSLAYGLKNNCKLTSMTLENCRLNSEGVVAILLALALNRRLKIFSLTDIPALASCWHSPCTVLQRKNLPDAEDTDEDDHGPLSAAAKALSDFMKCNTSLEQLRMRSCGLSDVAVKAMSAGLCANLAMPLSSCDLSENDLGDSSVAALLKACERRNYSYNKGAPLQQLNLTANRITKVGQLWIATYLKEAADNENKDMRILLSSQRSEQDPEATVDSTAGETGEADDVALILESLRLSAPASTMEEQLAMLKIRASGRKRKWRWEQAWKLIEPFLDSSLCFQAVQWAYRLLRTVLDKDAYSEQFDEFLQSRAQDRKNSRREGVSFGVEVHSTPGVQMKD